METSALLMRLIRREMRSQRPAELSMPQFRTLRILKCHPGLSLSQLATRLDLTLASASKLIDVLVKHGLVDRQSCSSDRRKIELHLTEHGWDTLKKTQAATQARLVDMLSALPAETQEMVLQAMQALQGALAERCGCGDTA